MVEIRIGMGHDVNVTMLCRIWYLEHVLVTVLLTSVGPRCSGITSCVRPPLQSWNVAPKQEHFFGDLVKMFKVVLFSLVFVLY